MAKQKPKGTPSTKEPDFALWESIAKDYEYIDGGQISNSFIVLLALAENGEPMSSTQLSEYMAKASKGQIFKIGATLRETLENRLRPAGYVEGSDVPNENGEARPTRKTFYKITPKGRKLLSGWLGFLKGIA